MRDSIKFSENLFIIKGITYKCYVPVRNCIQVPVNSTNLMAPVVSKILEKINSLTLKQVKEIYAQI